MRARHVHSALGLAIVVAGVAVVVQQTRPPAPVAAVSPRPPVVSSFEEPAQKPNVGRFVPAKDHAMDFQQVAVRTMITTLPITTPFAPLLLSTPEGEPQSYEPEASAVEVHSGDQEVARSCDHPPEGVDLPPEPSTPPVYDPPGNFEDADEGGVILE